MAWKYSLDLAKIWQNEFLDFETQRDLVVKRITEAKLPTTQKLTFLIDDIKKAHNQSLFDGLVMPELLIYCDQNEIFVKRN